MHLYIFGKDDLANILFQHSSNDEKLHPTHFISRKSPTKYNYSTYELEVLVKEISYVPFGLTFLICYRLYCLQTNHTKKKVFTKI